MLARIHVWLLCAALALFPALASAQSPIRAFPPGAFQNRAAIDAAPAAGFQGLGDAFTLTEYSSCAFTATSALANTSTSLCDLVDATTGTVAIGTLRGSSTGKVDLTAYFAGLVTPATACAAAAGGACRISKRYGQLAGTNFTNATASQMPLLTFSALNGLPGATFANGSSSSMATANQTMAQPYTMFAVYSQTTFNSNAGIIGGQAVQTGLVAGASANLVGISSSTLVTASATDNTFHAVSGLASGSGNNCALNVDGSDTASLNCGTVGISATPIRTGRNPGGPSLTGTMMEEAWFAGTSTPTNRSALSTNAHSSGRYNF